MHSTDILGYAWDADTHCPDCTEHAAACGTLKREPPLQMGTDQHGIALDLIDSEGNPVHPIFADEGTDDHCGDCGCALAGD